MQVDHVARVCTDLDVPLARAHADTVAEGRVRIAARVGTVCDTEEERRLLQSALHAVLFDDCLRKTSVIPLVYVVFPAPREGGADESTDETEVIRYAQCGAPTHLSCVHTLFLHTICAYPWRDRAAMVARAAYFLHEDLPKDMIVAVDLLLPPIEVFLDPTQTCIVDTNVGGPYLTLLALYGEVYRRCTTMPALAAPETWCLFSHLFA